MAVGGHLFMTAIVFLIILAGLGVGAYLYWKAYNKLP